MSFRTKLDFSDNRQVKQRIDTIQNLSGTTTFGITFSALPTGPDLTTTGITETYTSIASTFSGNSGTTVYTWYDPRMELGASSLSAITPAISATTQYTGQIYTANTITVIDNNSVILDYTGVSFNLVAIAMFDLGGGNYSGTVSTSGFNVLSAGTLDFTGRTIWADVSGITRTERLIVTNNPQIGYVLTCADSEGMAAWTPSSGGTSGGTSYWSASTGTNAIVIKNSTAIASGTTSLAEGTSIAGGNYSHAEGFNTTTLGGSSHSEGSGTLALGEASHAEGRSTTASGQYSHAEGGDTTAFGIRSHAEGDSNIANGYASHAEGSLTTALGTLGCHAGGYQSVASGQTSFVHGQNSIAGGVNTIVLGSNITGTTNNTTYVDSLNIKTVGAGPGTTDIGVDANGNVVDQASDRKLKENINTINNALSTVLALRGVTYNWKDREKGGNALKLGFIAQEVNDVIPELAYYNPNGDYMGVHYKDVTALLVEAIKELSSGVTTSNNTHLETQTILAEDNNIDLNYSGTPASAIGGGITVLHAMGENIGSVLITDEDGNWVTNNDFKSKALTIPMYTPTSSNDENGNEGNITRDNNFMYIKTSTGWKRSNLESF